MMRFGYFRVDTSRGTGYICVALERPLKEKNTIEPHRAGFSFCSPKDRFSKKLARTIATQRLTHQKPGLPVVEFLCNAPNNKLAIIEALHFAIKAEKTPNWVTRAFKKGDAVGQPYIRFSLTPWAGKGNAAQKT